MWCIGRLRWGWVSVAVVRKALAVAQTRDESILRAYAMLAVASCLWRLGQTQRAETLLHQCLQLSQLINDLYGCTLCLEMLAWVADSNDNPWRAVILMVAAHTVSRASGIAALAAAVFGGFHDACERHARQQLDPAKFQAAWNQGSSLTFDEAIAVALAKSH